MELRSAAKGDVFYSLPLASELLFMFYIYFSILKIIHKTTHNNNAPVSTGNLLPPRLQALRPQDSAG